MYKLASEIENFILSKELESMIKFGQQRESAGIAFREPASPSCIYKISTQHPGINDKSLQRQ